MDSPGMLQFQELEREIRRWDNDPRFGRAHNDVVLADLRAVHVLEFQSLVEACKILHRWAGHLRPNSMQEDEAKRVKEGIVKLRDSVIRQLLSCSGMQPENIDATIAEACLESGVPDRVRDELRNGVRRYLLKTKSPFVQEVKVGFTCVLRDNSLSGCYFYKGDSVRVMQEDGDDAFYVAPLPYHNCGWVVPLPVQRASLRVKEKDTKKSKKQTSRAGLAPPPGLARQPDDEEAPVDSPASSSEQGCPVPGAAEEAPPSPEHAEAKLSSDSDQENEEKRDAFRSWFVDVKNTFIDVKDTGSEASRDWASHAKTEPPGGQPRMGHKAKVIRMKVTMWLQQLDQQETDREMIPDIVEELRGCLEEVANNDPDLHELKPLKHSAVEAVRSVLVGGKLNTYNDRYKVAWALCSLQGTAFPSTDLGEEAELSELQAAVWTDYLNWMDDNHWLTENREKVVRDTIDMSAKALDRQLGCARDITISVVKATVKLICNFAPCFSGEFVESTGAWILKQMRDLYNDQWSVVCLRDDVEQLVEEMQTVQEQGPEEHNFDEIMRLLVYTHPLADIFQRVDSADSHNDNKLKATLKEIFAFFCLHQQSESILRDLQALGKAKCLEETHVKAGQDVVKWSERIFACLEDQTLWPFSIQQTSKQWFLGSWIVASLFGPKVVATFASGSVSHQRLNAEDSMCYHISRGLQQWHQQAGDNDDFCLKEFVVQQYLSQSKPLSKDNCEYLGKPCNWSAFVGIIGEFLAGCAWPEHGTPEKHQADQRFLRQVDSELERVACIFKENGKLRDLRWGPFWREFFWALQQFFAKTGLRENWIDFVNSSVEEMDAYLKEFMKEVSEHQLALSSARQLSQEMWSPLEPSVPYHEHYKW